MSKQRILTMDDLYECCLKNNLTTFSAEKSEKKLVVTTNGYFEVEEQEDIKESEGLLGLKVKIFHTGENLNKSVISKKVAEKYMSTIKDRPLLAYIHQLPDGQYDFSGHDRRIIINQDGDEEVEYIESPIGHFTNDEPWLEEDKGVKDKYYIYSNALVYEEYTKAAEILKRKNGSDCSMEIEIDKFEFDSKNKVLNILSFYIRGVTLLGSRVNSNGKVEKVQPGMKGAKVTLEDFMLDNPSDNGCIENRQKGGKDDMTKFEELLSKYSKTAEDIDFDYEGMSDEELEAKFAELFEGDEPADDDNGESVDTTEEPTVTSETEETEADSTDDEEDETSNTSDDDDEDESDTSKKKKFSLSVNELENGDLSVSYELSHDDIRCKIRKAIRKLEKPCDWLDIVAIYDTRFICYHNNEETSEYLSFNYEITENEEISIIGEPCMVHAEFLTDEEYSALKEMRANHEKVVTELETYKAKEAKQQKEDVLKKDEAFSKYLEEEEFKTLVEHMNEYSLDEFKEKADVAYGKCVKRIGIVATETPKRTRQLFSFENKTKEAYGGLFQK